MTGTVERIYSDRGTRVDLRILHRSRLEADYPEQVVLGLRCGLPVEVGDTVLFYARAFPLGNGIEEWRATDLAKLENPFTDIF